MPSVGLPAATRSRSSSVEPAGGEPAIAERADPTPGSTARSAHATSSGSPVACASAPRRSQATSDRADVAGAVLADGDPHSMPFVDGIPVALGAHRGAQRAADGLERRLGDVVRVAAAPPRRAGEASRLRERCRRTWSARPGSGSSASSARGPAAEIDGGARERVVHRHDGVAVARDPAAVAERPVERLAERERRVLGGVVVARLEVAGPLEDEVEAGVEGELLEEVVVEPGAGRDPHAARAVERRAARAMRVSAVARRWRTRRPDEPATGAGRSSARASASRSRSSSSRSRTVMRIPSGEDADDQPRPQERGRRAPAASSTGTKRKFAREGSGSSPSARSAAREPLALLDLRRRRPAATASAGDARARPRGSRPAPAPGGAFSSAAVSRAASA